MQGVVPAFQLAQVGTQAGVEGYLSDRKIDLEQRSALRGNLIGTGVRTGAEVLTEAIKAKLKPPSNDRYDLNVRFDRDPLTIKHRR
jgi:hypothetical protein